MGDNDVGLRGPYFAAAGAHTEFAGARHCLKHGRFPATAAPTGPVSADLANFSDSMSDLLRISVTPNPDGTQTELWRSLVPFPGDRRRYGRVRITVP